MYNYIQKQRLHVQLYRKKQNFNVQIYREAKLKFNKYTEKQKNLHLQLNREAALVCTTIKRSNACMYYTEKQSLHVQLSEKQNLQVQLYRDEKLACKARSFISIDLSQPAHTFCLCLYRKGKGLWCPIYQWSHVISSIFSCVHISFNIARLIRWMHMQKRRHIALLNNCLCMCESRVEKGSGPPGKTQVAI